MTVLFLEKLVLSFYFSIFTTIIAYCKSVNYDIVIVLLGTPQKRQQIKVQQIQFKQNLIKLQIQEFMGSQT